ncbi:MAG: hypothetical protein PHV06_01615 [bacterium]|nr:hypothetical protein [bacterium]
MKKIVTIILFAMFCFGLMTSRIGCPIKLYLSSDNTTVTAEAEK